MTRGKKAASILLCSAMVFSSFATSFAASYTDMSKHWAESYVQNIKEKQIISGYEDGSFKPDKSVSRLEAIIMISKMFSTDQINQVYASKKDAWEGKLVSYKIPDWSWPYVVFAVENNIIPGTDDFLSKIMNQSQKNVQNAALRYEVMVYMVRALNWESELGKTAVLKYKDIQTIPAQAIPYIDIMIKKGIIGESGDQNGNFGAQRPVTRAEMAVMLANAYKYASQLSPSINTDTAQAGSNNVTNVQTPSTIPSTGTQAVVNNSLSVMDGTVELVTSVGDYTSFTISSASGVFHSFGNNNSMIQIKIGNSPASLSDLKIKDKVKVLYEEGNKARNIIIADKEQKVTGVFSGTGMGTTIQLLSDGQVQSYVYDATTKITLDGINVDLSQIRANDQIEIFVLSGKATEVKAYSSNKTIYGTVADIRSSSIVIEENSRENKYEVADDVRITRNGSRVYNLNELGINDQITAVMQNGKITSIESVSVKSRIRKGVIKQILISSTKTQIIVADSDNKDYTLDVNINTQVRIDGRRSSVNDLKLGYEVDVYLDGNIIEEISADGSYKQSMYVGKVVYHDDRDRIIEMKDSDGNTIKVYYDSSTMIEDIKTGNTLRARQIYKGDDVTIVGIERLGGLDATRIMVSMQYY